MPRAAVLSIHARVAGAAGEGGVRRLRRPPISSSSQVRARGVSSGGSAAEGARRAPPRAGARGGVRRSPAGEVGGGGVRGDWLLRADNHGERDPVGECRRPPLGALRRPPSTRSPSPRWLRRRSLHMLTIAAAAASPLARRMSAKAAAAAFASLRPALTAVRTPIGEADILTSDEPLLRADPGPAAPARLLPERRCVLPALGRGAGAARPAGRSPRRALEPRVWPGAILLDGEIRVRGGGRTTSSRFRPGTGSRAPSAPPSRLRRPACRCPASSAGSASAGTTDPGVGDDCGSCRVPLGSPCARAATRASCSRGPRRLDRHPL